MESTAKMTLQAGGGDIDCSLIWRRAVSTRSLPKTHYTWMNTSPTFNPDKWRELIRCYAPVYHGTDDDDADDTFPTFNPGRWMELIKYLALQRPYDPSQVMGMMMIMILPWLSTQVDGGNWTQLCSDPMTPGGHGIDYYVDDTSMTFKPGRWWN